jgi:hypothetical protein
MNLLPPRLPGMLRKPKAVRLRVRFANASAALILKGQVGEAMAPPGKPNE